ncbi:MAG: energy transducer TonB [Gemmatimonadaceae bacterium]
MREPRECMSRWADHRARPVATTRYIARMADSVRCGTALAALAALAFSSGCMDRDTSQKVAQAFQAGTAKPDEKPLMLNSELPFRYPPVLYAQKVQGNVTLYLHIDRTGQVRPDSTRIEESSGYAALDSAAVTGSQELRFVPAKLRGEPISVSVLFPVYFRHPEAHALPGDTILTKPQPPASPRER